MITLTTHLDEQEASLARWLFRSGVGPWSIAARLRCTQLALDGALVNEPGYKTSTELLP